MLLSWVPWKCHGRACTTNGVADHVSQNTFKQLDFWWLSNTSAWLSFVALTLVFNIASQSLFQRILFNVFAVFSWDRIILVMTKYTKINNSNMLWSMTPWHFLLLTWMWQPVGLYHMNYVSLSAIVWNFCWMVKEFNNWCVFTHPYKSTYALFSRREHWTFPIACI